MVIVIRVDISGHLDTHGPVLHLGTEDEVVWISDEAKFTLDFYGHNPFTTPDADFAIPKHVQVSGPIRGGAAIYKYHVHETHTVHDDAVNAGLPEFGPHARKKAKSSTRSDDGEVIIYP